jgi:hypothetical protein
MTYSTDLIYQYVEKDIYFILFLLTKNVKNKIPKLQSSIFCLPQLQLYIDSAAYKASIYIPSACLRVLTDIKHAPRYTQANTEEN